MDESKRLSYKKYIFLKLGEACMFFSKYVMLNFCGLQLYTQRYRHIQHIIMCLIKVY